MVRSASGASVSLVETSLFYLADFRMSFSGKERIFML